MKYKTMILGICMVAGTVLGGVFDDAKIWVREAYDKNGDGWVKTSRSNVDTRDFPDALKGGNATAQTHVWSARGQATNIHVVVADVVNPLACTTRKAPYIHFDQFTWLAGTVTNAYSVGLLNTNFMPPVTNTDWRTAYMRFRLESFMSTNECANLMTFGHSASSGKGAGWKLMLVPDNEGSSFHFKVVNGRPQDSAAETGVGTKEFDKCAENSIYRLSTNTWVDVVFACGKTNDAFTVDIYSCAVGGVFCGETQGIGWYSTNQADSKSYNNQCWIGGVVGSYVATTSLRSFRGDVAAFAYWDRRLTEDEAYVVMSEPRTDVFALGVKNNSAEEFAGAAGAVIDATATNAFLAVPSAIAAGESFSVTFTLDATNGLGLAQAIRLSSIATSSDAKFSVVANGKSTFKGFLRVAAGETTVTALPAKVFQEGANTLVFTRIDTGTAAFVPDAIALGGSWSIGVKDNSHSEFAYTTAADTTRYTRTADANWKHAVINLANSKNWAVNRLYAYVDPTLAQTWPHRFVARLGAKRDSKLSRIPMSAELRVNGGTAQAIQLTADDYTGYRDFEFLFAPGTLQGGLNYFELTNTSGTPTDGEAEGFISFDCRYLEVIPTPPGLSLYVR